MQGDVPCLAGGVLTLSMEGYLGDKINSDGKSRRGEGEGGFKEGLMD